MNFSEEELDRRLKIAAEIFAEAFHREFRRQAFMRATRATLYFKKCVKPERKIRRRK